MPNEKLKLDNQICFPIYAASRLITREYQPYLNKLGITYPQYLVLLVLWEKDTQSVNEISQKLILNTNTLTPLLKRMESMEIITRTKSEEDERKVIIQLTDKGKKMQNIAAIIPEQLGAELIQTALTIEDLISLKEKLNVIIDYLNKKEIKD